MDKTASFEGLQENYRRFRPDYPRQVLAALAAYALGSPAPAARLIIDVGSGTGISTRAIAEVLGGGFEYLGVEPNAAMRREAELDLAKPNLRYTDGNAEKLPCPDGAALVVCAAQAVQWFDRPAFYAEAARALANRGTLALLQNNRRWQVSEFLERYEEFLEAHSAGYSRDYRAFSLTSELSALPQFFDVQELSHEWTRHMPTEEFIGMSLSSTKTQKAVDRLGREAVIALLTELTAPYGGELSIPYVTEMYLARRKET